MQQHKVVVENLYKVFHSKPADALKMIKAGKTKEEVFEATGKVVGVNDISFSVDEGEIFVLMGLSGSGKSTLIRLINRLVEPSAGKILVDNKDVAKLSSRDLLKLRRTDMSMVFQSFGLMPHQTVLQNAAFGLEIAGVPRKKREEAAIRILEQVGLHTYAAKYPHQLSGGMQQRVGLARALTVNPSLMLMDEAFSALDPLRRHEMQGVLLDLQQQEQRTIIFVSHDLEEALRIGSRIAIMEGGRLVQVGTAKELLENPANDYVRNFFKSVDTSRYLIARTMLDTETVVVLTEGQSGSTLPSSCRWVVYLKTDGKLLGIVPQEVHSHAMQVGKSFSEVVASSIQKTPQPISATTILSDVLHAIFNSQGMPIPVIEENGQCLGAVTSLSGLHKMSEGGHHA